MSFGSCQYDDIYSIVKRNIKNVLGENKYANFQDLANTEVQLDFCPESGLEVAKIEILKINLEITCSRIIEQINLDSIILNNAPELVLGIFQTELFKMKSTNISDDEIDAINEILSFVERIIKVTTISELIIYIKDSAWDLWGCVRTVTPFFGLNLIDDGDEDTEIAYGILYLIWKYDIEDWDEVFSRFST